MRQIRLPKPDRGKVSADLQYRYENVDQPTSGLNLANVHLPATALGYANCRVQGLAPWSRLSIAQSFIQQQTNGQTGYSVVADPGY